MFAERLLTPIVRSLNKRCLSLSPASVTKMPPADPGKIYMLYAHVPFCERLCPYCSFNRFPFNKERALAYFERLYAEATMLKELGYDFDSVYIGGGTPTILIDELVAFIDFCKENFSIKEISTETNPNHLTAEYLDKLVGRVDRLSVGVQSFDNELLKHMDRYTKYGSSEEIIERIKFTVANYPFALNVDLIFNLPGQTEEQLRYDLATVKELGSAQCTFYPLMASPAVQKSLAATMGKVTYTQEAHYYNIICEELVDSANAPFVHSSAWTFSRVGTPDAELKGAKNKATASPMIDEYIVDHEEYPAIGSGGLTFLQGALYVNTFSVQDYIAKIDVAEMSIAQYTTFSKRNRMRYRFLMQIFGMHFDKAAFKRDFGVSLAKGLPMEYLFMKIFGGFGNEKADSIEISHVGRYLAVVIMREFFIGVNSVRDQARAALPPDERKLLFASGFTVEELLEDHDKSCSEQCTYNVQ